MLQRAGSQRHGLARGAGGGQPGVAYKKNWHKSTNTDWFTGTKAQILTQLAEVNQVLLNLTELDMQVLSLLALLVQQYKY